MTGIHDWQGVQQPLPALRSASASAAWPRSTSAQDEVLGRLVAVKVMLPQYAADPTFTQALQARRPQRQPTCSNPYIVNVYDWGQDDGTYYIVMEYIRG